MNADEQYYRYLEEQYNQYLEEQYNQFVMEQMIERTRELAALSEKARPGPWHVIPNPEWGNADCRIDSNPDAPWENFGQICYTSPNNAALIAAAPEMAKLLAHMADRIEELEGKVGGSGHA